LLALIDKTASLVARIQHARRRTTPGTTSFHALTFSLQSRINDLVRELRCADGAAPAVLGDWLRTRLGLGRLGLSEYFDFNLHRLKGLSASDRAAFVGIRKARGPCGNPR
jgi:hypothetical protein